MTATLTTPATTTIPPMDDDYYNEASKTFSRLTEDVFWNNEKISAMDYYNTKERITFMVQFPIINPLARFDGNFMKILARNINHTLQRLANGQLFNNAHQYTCLQPEFIVKGDLTFDNQQQFYVVCYPQDQKSTKVESEEHNKLAIITTIKLVMGFKYQPSVSIKLPNGYQEKSKMFRQSFNPMTLLAMAYNNDVFGWKMTFFEQGLIPYHAINTTNTNANTNKLDEELEFDGIIATEPFNDYEDDYKEDYEWMSPDYYGY